MSDGSRNFGHHIITPYNHKTVTAVGPSRFDLPDVEDVTSGIFSSFDDLTYNSDPVIHTGDSANRASNNDKNEETSNSKDKAVNDDNDWVDIPMFENPSTAQGNSSQANDDSSAQKKSSNSMENAKGPEDPLGNHAKIIKEVLKKYPHLVKNNKNIRLKIVQKGSKKPESPNAGKTKVSYTTLKSDDFLSEIDGESGNNPQGGGSGPWKCKRCNINEEYATYNTFRRHMQNVHNEKFDPKICEYCGYKASKRNVLMYHLYTKHDVAPPKNISFPSCEICSYVALSEAILARHKLNHKNNKKSSAATVTIKNENDTVSCVGCDQIFDDVIQLASHEAITGHGAAAEKASKTFCCSFCDKMFKRKNDLQMHLDRMHLNCEDYEDEDRVSKKKFKRSVGRDFENYLMHSLPRKMAEEEIIEEFIEEVDEEEEEEEDEMDYDSYDIETSGVEASRIPEEEIIEVYEELEQEGGERNKTYTNLNARKFNASCNDKYMILSKDFEDQERQMNEEVVEVIEEVVQPEDEEEEEGEQIYIEKLESDVIHSFSQQGRCVVVPEGVDLIQYVEEETEVVEYDGNYVVTA